MRALTDKIIEALEKRAYGQFNEFARKQLLFAVEEIKELAEKAKLKEITPADIEAWAEKEYGCSGIQAHLCKREVNIAISGAKAALNGEIKHIEK